MNRLLAAMITGLMTMSVWLYCQQTPAPDPSSPAPNVRSQDVDTVDGIIRALYEVISGPAGQKRDWGRFRSLFAPGARLIPALARQGEATAIRVLDVEAYISRVDPIFEKEYFWETEKERRTDAAGNLVHVFSTYESRRAPGGQPFQAGVNSIQLFQDGTRWWIVTVMWNATR